MSERNNIGLDEAASIASNTTQAVRAGKAISAAAKGAAAGGPCGAAIGAALSARNQIGITAAAVLTLLALPLLFVLLLPGLVFGSLTNSGASGQSVLNDGTAITENMNQAAFAINQILGEGVENVQERIADDFAMTGGDHYNIINPYVGDLISNINLFISQYCAAKAQDFASISLADMEQILRAGLTHLYSFSRTMEVRAVPAEKDGEEDTTETWYIYTIRYNGEAYFADTIFALTDAQKNWQRITRKISVCSLATASSNMLSPQTPFRLSAMCVLPTVKPMSPTSTSWMNAMRISRMARTTSAVTAVGRPPWLSLSPH